MDTPIKWLKEQQAKAQQDFEEAQKRLNTWTEALELAGEGEDLVAAPASSDKPQPRREGPAIPELIIEILTGHKSLTCAQLVHYLQENKNKKAEYTSVNVALNRLKRKGVVNKTKAGKWHLVSTPKRDGRLVAIG